MAELARNVRSPDRASTEDPDAPAASTEQVTHEAPPPPAAVTRGEPDEGPIVEVGDAVGPGETLCILEAMKLMNEVKADIEGIVRAIHVENAQPVEFGQLLFELEPVARPVDAV